jgi:hypothetical protein
MTAAAERSTIGWSGARALVPVVLAVFMASCNERGTGAGPRGSGPSSPPLVPTTGGCHDVEIDGACTLLGVTRIGDGDDMVIRPDAARTPMAP